MLLFEQIDNESYTLYKQMKLIGRNIFGNQTEKKLLKWVHWYKIAWSSCSVDDKTTYTRSIKMKTKRHEIIKSEWLCYRVKECDHVVSRTANEKLVF